MLAVGHTIRTAPQRLDELYRNAHNRLPNRQSEPLKRRTEDSAGTAAKRQQLSPGKTSASKQLSLNMATSLVLVSDLGFEAANRSPRCACSVGLSSMQCIISCSFLAAEAET
jgi:hypothetical protein